MIHLIPAKEMSDHQLYDEYRDISKAVRWALTAYAVDDTYVPRNYSTTKDNKRFFFDKMAYLHKRFALICEEIRNRGISLNEECAKETSLRFCAVPAVFYNEYVPNHTRIEKSRYAATVDDRCEHEFSPRTPTGYKNEYSRKCQKCNFVDIYEKDYFLV